MAIRAGHLPVSRRGEPVYRENAPHSGGENRVVAECVNHGNDHVAGTHGLIRSNRLRSGPCERRGKRCEREYHTRKDHWLNVRSTIVKFQTTKAAYQ